MDDTEIVFLKVDPTLVQEHGKRATLCETLLGFRPGHFLPGDKRVMVAGIIPGGALMKTGGGLQVGDWLISINDLDVNHDNIDALLSAITRPKKIKLTLQPINKRNDLSTSSSGVQPQQQQKQHRRSHSTVSSTSSHSISSSVLRPLGPGIPSTDAYSDDAADNSFDNTLHALMYLTTESPAKQKTGSSSSKDEANSKRNDDVIYMYPNPRDGDDDNNDGDVDNKNKISELRGLFETLPQLLRDVTDDAIKSSTLVVNDELLHVAYVHSEPEVLILGASASFVSAEYLRDVVKDISRLLLVIYGSLQTAFKDPVNQKQMDQFLKVFFGQIMTNRGEPHLLNSGENRFFCRLSEAVRWIPLNHSIRSTISSTLSNYESADFAEISDDYYDIRRQYTIVGATLFYRGFLIGSHLPKEDLLDIGLYLKYTNLLQMSKTQMTSDPIVVWREAFPTRRYHDPSGDAPVLGYSEPVDARWFLLVVSLKKLLLTALLEAGGCSQWAEGTAVSPDAFYVDQAKSCLQQLESLDIPGSCELALRQFAPPTVCADLAIVDSAPDSASKKTTTSSPSIVTSRSSISNRASISSLKADLDNVSLASSGGGGGGAEEMRRTNSINSIESGDSSVSSTALSYHEKLKGKTSSRFMPSLEQLSRKSSNLSEDGDGSRIGGFSVNPPLQRQSRLSAGGQNSLFHYLYFQEVEGIFVAADDPSDYRVHPDSGRTSFHADILRNFYTSALTIRNTFEETLRVEEEEDRGRVDQLGLHHNHHQTNHKENFRRFAGVGRRRVYEEGILFHFTPSPNENASEKKGSASSLTYWVVGRMFPEPDPQQIYVCFRDGVEQNLVEMAFKLGFGIGI